MCDPACAEGIEPRRHDGESRVWVSCQYARSRNVAHLALVVQSSSRQRRTPPSRVPRGTFFAPSTVFPCLRADLITPRRAPRDAVSSVPIVVNYSPFKKRDTRIRHTSARYAVFRSSSSSRSFPRVHRRRSKPARSFDDRRLTPPHAVSRRRRVRRAARRPGAHGRGRARVRFPRTRSRPGPRLFVAADGSRGRTLRRLGSRNLRRVCRHRRVLRRGDVRRGIEARVRVRRSRPVVLVRSSVVGIRSSVVGIRSSVVGIRPVGHPVVGVSVGGEFLVRHVRAVEIFKVAIPVLRGGGGFERAVPRVGIRVRGPGIRGGGGVRQREAA